MKNLKYFLKRWDQILSIALIFLIIVLGAFLDIDGWLVNISAGLAGIFVGVLIAVSFLDQIQAYFQEREWVSVRKLTYRSITGHLMCFVNQAILNFSPLLSDDLKAFVTVGLKFRPTDVTANIIQTLIQELGQLPAEIKMTNAEMLTSLLTTTRWDLDRVCNVLIPRILHYSTNKELLEAAIWVDLARGQLEHNVSARRDFQNTDVFVDLLWFLGKINEFLKTVAYNWE